MTFRAICLGMVAALALGGCGGVRQTLGLVRNSPDEFAVVAKPPLTLPPDFGLRPPVPGAPPMGQQADPVAQAANALAPNAAPQPPRTALTAGETALLGAAGATNTD